MSQATSNPIDVSAMSFTDLLWLERGTLAKNITKPSHLNEAKEAEPKILLNEDTYSEANQCEFKHFLKFGSHFFYR